ncbi:MULTISPECIES: hypothetical protein [Rhodopseudomonas]|uniref:Uncharacterized protein n=1 Tax=Rhodopseudomonas palustris TaxID=1076 RepID=A0A0D7DY21_RHOPL|nr:MULTISPECIES: hypothetical protein [Rhodopseudomonas]KIZ33100.1 hypothetical protein OO17_28920 [Rhodopseudomonas palustris]MDF3810371.1 hypothetical protein [Rhodopseudomonas sp. BAL398]WOK19981.1 hypothetical protein RBJ75_10895 [Rhodopseudomonas sp. BAL398]
MAVSTIISPVNSLVFIHGPRGWQSPLPVDGQLIWSTASCVATACFPEVEGPTKIILGLAAEVDPGGAPAFVGTLETPHKIVTITAVADDRPLLSHDVPGAMTPIRIWHSHPRWPDVVTVGLG